MANKLERWMREVSRSQQQLIGRVPARRLTKREYQYTVQDLLGIEGDVTGYLPDEADAEGFDTVCSTQ